MHDPREPHLAALKRILWYVRGTLDHGLQLHVSTTTQLTAYIDADWAGCPVTRRSTSGYCVFLGDNLLSWSAKRQVTLSCSSAEAEYRGVANVVAETTWIRNLLLELHLLMNQPNISKTPDVPVKRKRGRPRKDENISKNREKTHSTTSDNGGATTTSSCGHDHHPTTTCPLIQGLIY
ncbi:ribonuclease H-like domain-containing protein [Tanacetum coccineum]